MAEALTTDDQALIRALSSKLTAKRKKLEELERVYLGTQAISYLGLAVPEEMRAFEFPLAWPRTYVDEIERRQDVKQIIAHDDVASAKSLQDGWRYNNMDAELPLYNRDKLIYGHGFISVSVNELDREHPLIRVESPKSLACEIDQRHRTIKSALRLYSEPGKAQAPDQGTLYLPDRTVWFERSKRGKWQVTNTDNHNLGFVSLILGLNRRRTGEWTGESEMTDLLGITDFAARALMNLQVAMETHSVPARYLFGVTKGDFVDAETNEPLDVWQAYFTSMFVNGNKDAKLGQLPASDLTNFIDTIAMLGQQASAVTGLPMRYFGQNTANPAAEGAIRADESRVVKNVERKNLETGAELGWMMALYERLRPGGVEIPGSQIRIEWHDPATPTFSEKADGIQKLNGGTPVLSRAGSWDEMGWTPERQTLEQNRFKDQDADPYINLHPLGSTDGAPDTSASSDTVRATPGE